ncbi:hypothetical protein SAMN05660964_02732 [Thiothrix caldifontis]|uniref:Uncharacterized protein n=1 Tax=Thiothrix caldifontis TaxID=525918 RepID=A0A1H4EVM6_9GAMM|nr:hypothetical protein [Thiothrix caldifontis]SEA89084.1 hypothetical protein SAMN05660964_02732 [Thiothrix caldifontis]
MKPTTRIGQIDYILQQLSHQELQTFVREKALQDTDFRDTLLICFADLLGSDTSSEPKYRQMLADMTQRHANAEGYIHANSTLHLTTAIRNVLAVARKATTPTRETIDLCLAVISDLPILANKMEDPEEHIYTLMRTACTTLWECYSVLPIERQQALFERILQEYAKPVYLDLDLDNALLSLLKDWAQRNSKRQRACLHQLEQLLKTVEHDPWRKNYLLEQTKSLLSFWKA